MKERWEKFKKMQNNFKYPIKTKNNFSDNGNGDVFSDRYLNI